MKKSCFLLPLLFNAVCSGSLVTVDLTVSPVVRHYYDVQEPGIVSIHENVSILIPKVSLEAGDTLRINITFTQGIQINNANSFAMDIYLNSELCVPDNDMTSWLNDDGSAMVNMTEQEGYNIINKTGILDCFYNSDYYNFDTDIYFGKGVDFVEGAIVKAFTISITIPENIDTSSLLSNLYSGNLYILTNCYADADINLLAVVPEPMSLFLFGLGGILIRQRNKVVKSVP